MGGGGGAPLLPHQMPDGTTCGRSAAAVARSPIPLPRRRLHSRCASLTLLRSSGLPPRLTGTISSTSARIGWGTHPAHSGLEHRGPCCPRIIVSVLSTPPPAAQTTVGLFCEHPLTELAASVSVGVAGVGFACHVRHPLGWGHALVRLGGRAPVSVVATAWGWRGWGWACGVPPCGTHPLGVRLTPWPPMGCPPCVSVAPTILRITPFPAWRNHE